MQTCPQRPQKLGEKKNVTFLSTLATADDVKKQFLRNHCIYNSQLQKRKKKKEIHRYLVVSEAIIAPLRKRKEQQKIIVV